MPLRIPFDNTYARLPERFFAPQAPSPVRSPKLMRVNAALAEALGLDVAALESPEGVDVLSGNRVPEGAEPIALAYSGHQFGHFVPQLGDGRAILMGEVVGRDGVRRDLQWKGSGRTRFSRGGDGRAALGPVLREYVLSEALHALGIPTTRALAAVTTGEPVLRETALPGAVLLRVAASHLRVGTFCYFGARRDEEGLRILANYAMKRHYEAALEAAHPVRALLEAVVARQADLVAKWMSVGFIHGVMNTDNSSISGETIDYGPCAFMDAYHPGTVFSSIDHQGRYAYGNQPRIAGWNLARLAEALLPLLAENEDEAIVVAQATLDGFAPRFSQAHAAAFRAKIGLTTTREGDDALVEGLLSAMASGAADFTLTFRGLAAAVTDPAKDADVRALFREGEAFDAWANAWRLRLAYEPGDSASRGSIMRAVNPAYIPRNHRVEEAIQSAIRGDFGPFEALVEVLARPFDEQPGREAYAAAPQPEERVLRTFCGT
jgi:uncharacterized protein YdiU (UPF0061 family)